MLVQTDKVHISNNTVDVQEGRIMEGVSSLGKGNNQDGPTQPRLLHPKKRKFDLAELEESENSTSNGKAVQNNCNSLHQQAVLTSGSASNFGTIIAVSSTIVPQMVITSIKTPATDEKQASGENGSSPFVHQEQHIRFQTTSEFMNKKIVCNYKPLQVQNPTAVSTATTLMPVNVKSAGQFNYSHPAKVSKMSQPSHYVHQPQFQDQELVDLTDWCDSRILAKRRDHYATGVIRSTEGKNAIIIEFDYPEGSTEIFRDIFCKGRFAIVSDASPPISDVSMAFF